MELFSINSKEEFWNILSSEKINKWRFTEEKIAKDMEGEKEITLQGYCHVCEQSAQFYVDWMYSDGNMPNYRERLVCKECRLNNRQRFMAYLVNKELASILSPIPSIFCYEAVTHFFKWLSSKYPTSIGSEFLGFDLPSGSVVQGIRHEDAMNLSFPDESMDLIISQDVFEHVPDIEISIQEVGRVLKPNGVILFSIPFHAGCESSIQRAAVHGNGIIKYLAEPVYHGNPIDSNGSLVFWDIGWDIFSLCNRFGIKLQIIAGWNLKYGYIGGLPFVFRGTKQS